MVSVLLSVFVAAWSGSNAQRLISSLDLHIETYSTNTATVYGYIECCEGIYTAAIPPRCVRSIDDQTRASCRMEVEICLLAGNIKHPTPDIDGTNVKLLFQSCIVKMKRLHTGNEFLGRNVDNTTFRFPISASQPLALTEAQVRNGVTVVVAFWHVPEIANSQPSKLRDVFTFRRNPPPQPTPVSQQVTLDVNFGVDAWEVRRVFIASLGYTCLSPLALANTLCQLPNHASTRSITSRTQPSTSAIVATARDPLTTTGRPRFIADSTTAGPAKTISMTKDDNNENGPSIMLIAGAAAGGLVVIIILVLVAMTVRQRSHKRRLVQAQVTQNPYANPNQELDTQQLDTRLAHTPDGYLQPKRGRRKGSSDDMPCNPDGYLQPVGGRSSRSANGLLHKADGYLQPVRASGDRQPRRVIRHTQDGYLQPLRTRQATNALHASNAMQAGIPQDAKSYVKPVRKNGHGHDDKVFQVHPAFVSKEAPDFGESDM
eukprot:TRINITY_DN12375_c0_g1_i2.p2 TRINITY_DN12375_c0_g1~~TRINITY_DN12375_c0_g1_i2.p2  ORF type:complete len:487 (+),score=94.70 TRINITY_DN12375_c0_g1_i2:4572-6032(+)